MHNIEELHDGRAVVCDRLSAILVDEQQVTAVGTECALDCRLDCSACVDVGKDLVLALRLVGAYNFIVLVNMFTGAGEFEDSNLL